MQRGTVSNYRDKPAPSASGDSDEDMTLEAATGSSSPTCPRGGQIALVEFQRVRAAGVAIGGAYTKSKYHRSGYTYAKEDELGDDDRARLRRIGSAERDAVIQNDFASVGAGPNRFTMCWGS